MTRRAFVIWPWHLDGKHVVFGEVLEVRPSKQCSPRHPTRFTHPLALSHMSSHDVASVIYPALVPPSFIEFNVIL